MDRDLPPALVHAVAAALSGAGGAALRRDVAALSAHYRAGGTSGPDLAFAAYLAARLPATFAAASRVLAELGARWPAFAPAALIDAGAGPGTASWAATGRWPDLARVTLLDSNAGFLALARRLAAAGPPALRRATARHASLLDPVAPAADLVVAAYALAELPLADAARAATSLWQATAGALALIEPGTPQGFARIAAARAALLADGARIIAPCPGAVACPMAGGDWCHFTVRLPRRRQHRHAKGASVPFEDEPFSYLIASRGGGRPAADRVLGRPQVGKAQVIARLCTAQGLHLRHVARRDGAAYKQAKHWEWGGSTANADD